MRNETKPSKTTVLVAATDVAYGAALADFLAVDGYAVERCHDVPGVLRLAGRRQFDVAVLDLALEEDDRNVDLVSFVRRQAPATQLILLFDLANLERAVEGVRQGAHFYLPKTSPPTDVALVVGKALRSRETRSTALQYEHSLFEETVGAAPAMRRAVETISKVAPTDSTVLILGESGTGKEVLARAVHRLSRRNELPFVAVNCAALPEGLLESELFGHVKGAFTGAVADKRGLFEEADRGTVFLDEIGDMALVTQAKLLRVLQNGEIRPVGAASSQRVDVRIIAATNRDLDEAVRARQFREDLYFRLNVVQVRIPPLRERIDALPALVNHFLARFNAQYGKDVQGLDDHAQLLLQEYEYPGNVRELESIIHRAVIMCDGVRIRAKDLPDQVIEGARPRLALPNHSANNLPTLKAWEERLIRVALERLEGNQTEAAKRLGISRSTLWRKMKEYGIDSAAPTAPDPSALELG